MHMASRYVGLGLCLLCSACGAINGSFPRTHSLIPDAAIRLTPDYSISLADIVLIAGITALVYQVVDPRAPAWEITETRFPDNRVLFSLKMQRLHMGGEGEARQVLARRARALAAEPGFTGYEIRHYEESIDSRIWLPQRLAEAEVQLIAAR